MNNPIEQFVLIIAHEPLPANQPWITLLVRWVPKISPVMVFQIPLNLRSNHLLGRMGEAVRKGTLASRPQAFQE